MTYYGTADKVTIMIGDLNDTLQESGGNNYNNFVTGCQFRDMIDETPYGTLTLEGVLATDSNIDSEKPVYFLFGVTSGTYKCYKFRIREVEFRYNGTCVCSLEPSAGKDVSGVFKNILHDTDNIGTTVTVGETYIGNITDLFDTDYGIVTDVAYLDSSDDGGDYPLNFRITTDKRIDIIKDSVKGTSQEWWIDWGGTDGSGHPDFSEDTVHVSSRRGSGTSAYTFYLNTDGGNAPNAYVGGIIKNKSDIKNFVTLQGKSHKGNSIYGRAILNSDTETNLHDDGLDTFLTANFDVGDATITVDSTACFKDSSGTTNTGTFEVVIDDERVQVSVASATSLTVVSRASGSTTETNHLSGADVLYYADEDLSGTISVNVDSTASFASSGGITIGNESFGYADKNANAFLECARFASVEPRWKQYAHHIGDQIVQKTVNQNTSDSGTSVNDYGLRGYNRKGLRSSSSAQLDIMARQIADNSNAEIQKLYITPIDSRNTFATIDVGDDVTINSTQLNLSSDDYRVVGLEVNYVPGGFGIQYTLNKDNIRVFIEKNNQQFIDELNKFDVKNPIPSSQDVLDNINNVIDLASAKMKNLLQLDNVGVNFEGIAAASKTTPDEAGNMYYDTTADELKFRNSSSWVSLGGSGSGFWTDEGDYLKASEDTIVIETDASNYISIESSGGVGSISAVNDDLELSGTDITITAGDDISLVATNNFDIEAGSGDNITNKLGGTTSGNLFRVVDSADAVLFQVDGTGVARVAHDASTYLSLISDATNSGLSAANSSLRLYSPDANLKIESAGGYDIEIHSDDDIECTLGDSSGADEFVIKDSGGNTRFSVNSDGGGRYWDSLEVDAWASIDEDLDVGIDCRIDNDLDVGADCRIVGDLNKGTGSFTIDHPLDPENKILRHSFVESPEMMNLYRFTIKVKKDKYSKVDLPEYFWALNKDVKVQVTPIEELAMCTYKLSKEKVEVMASASCELDVLISGVRQDKLALKRPIIVETDKDYPGYIHPEAFGLTCERYPFKGKKNENKKKK